MSRKMNGGRYCLILIILVFIIVCFANLALASSQLSRPSAISPDINIISQESTIIPSEKSEILHQSESLVILNSVSPCVEPFQMGGNRLAALQNDDGGWDWPLDDGNPGNPSPLNTVGPIAMGLSYAYLHTGDDNHSSTLQDAGALLLSKTNNFSPSDGYLAAMLDHIFGGTTYVDHVTTNFYDPLAAGTYDRNGAGTHYDTAEYVNLIRTVRASQGIANLAAWDIGMGLVGAATAGAETTAWIDGVKAEINELDGNAFYDVIGLAGAIYGLAFVGVDFDPTSGQHATASNIADLADILAGYQLNTGGFTWSMNSLTEDQDNETIQETAYAVLALNEVDRTGYYNHILNAVNYMKGVQLPTGGWKSWAYGDENNEITGEALWAIAIGLPGGPVSSNVLADPNPASVASLVNITANIDNALTGCAYVASAEYQLNGSPWSPLDATDENFDSLTETVQVQADAPNEAGIYDLCVRGVDAIGNVGAEECILLVVYNPDGGFVTGGGWIESPVKAYKPNDYDVYTLVWNQGFEIDSTGWYDTTDSWYGAVNKVPSLNEGINSAAGNYHAVFEGDSSSGPFTRFDEYRDTWQGMWTAEIDIFLDPAWASGQGFDYSVAANGSDGEHQRDYIFHVTKDTSSGSLLVAGSNNTNFAPREDLENLNNYQIATAGWYTFQHVFYEEDGALAVDLNLLDSNGDLLFAEKRYDGSDIIPDEVGGNRYGWFTFINVENGIAVDEHQLFTYDSPSGKATFGFVSKYKKGASVPTGNTEFVFKAVDLNFHSSSYDWLLVTGSDYAKYKGTGTINNAPAPNGMDYKFQVWAGDGDPDTFRIKIWYEDDGNELVVYDNGMDQEIGGGSIIVHTKKK